MGQGFGRRVVMIVLATLLFVSALIAIPGDAYGVDRDDSATSETDSTTTTVETGSTTTTVAHDDGPSDRDATTDTSTVVDDVHDDETTTDTSTVVDDVHDDETTTDTSTVVDEDTVGRDEATASTVGEDPVMETRLLEGVPVEVPVDSATSDPGAGLLADVPSVPNPTLANTCGLNIALVFDRSGSVSEFETDFKNAAKAFVDALQGTPSTIGLTGFAGISVSGGNGIGEVRAPMTAIATVAGANTVKAAIDAIPFGGLGTASGTNWEDGFKVVGGTDFEPSSGGLTPPIDVILFMTDGNPTTHDGSIDPGFSEDDIDVDEGVVQANIWKTNGTRIIAVGIGDDLDVDNLKRISGDVENLDYFITDFESIGEGLEALAIASCTSTVTITKNVDDNSDGVYEVSNGTPDWTFEADATQSVGNLTWESPTGANPVSDSVGTDGVVLFDWLLDELDATTDIDITETVNPDWIYDQATTCTIKTFAQPTAQPFPVTENDTGDGFSLSAIPRDGVVACDVFNTGVATELLLTKTASPTSVSTPGVVNYSFSIENTGNVVLTNVTVTDPLPGLTISGDPIPTLAPGATDSTTFTATYNVSQAEIDAGDPIPNTATATSTEGASDTDDATVTINQNPGLTLLKQGTLNDGGDGVDAGDTITYAFTVTNSGNTTVTGITIDDTVMGVTVEGGPIDLAPGASDTETFTGTYTIVQADIDAGEFQNCATANGIGPDGQTPVSSEEACTTETLPQTPLITLVKDGTFDDGGNGQADPGDIIAYTFTITNTGNVTLSDVTVTDTVGGVVIDGDPIATMPPGGIDTDTFTGEYAITQDDIDSGVFANTATVTGTDPGGAPVTGTDDHVIQPAQDFELSVTKTADPTTISAPQTINYTFVIENTGNTSLTNVQLADPDLTTGPVCDWEGSSDPDTGANVLSPGETVPCTGSYDATQDDIDDGADIVNIATATSDESPDATGTATVAVQQNPGLVLTKSGTVVDGGNGVDPGDTITYTFTIENTGNVTMFLVDITEDVAGVTVTGGPVTTEMAPGDEDTDTFTGVYTITQADIDAGTFENCATPTAQFVDVGEFEGTQGCEPNDLPQTPGIAVAKTGTLDVGDDGVATPGDVITYDFTITNTGNVTLTGVTLSDPVVTDAACDWTTTSLGSPEAELIPGETVKCAGTYPITQVEIDLGFRDNTAVVTGTPPIGGDVTDNDTETIDIEQEPALVLTKTANPTSVSAPGVVDYTLTVENTGNVTLTTIQITDLLPGITISGGPITSLSPGDTDSTTFSATFNVSDVHFDAGDDIVNTATATSAQGATDTDTATVGVVQNPGLTILKTSLFNDESGDGSAQVGETISYFFAVTNTGNVTLTDITVDDPKITVVGGPIDELAPGAVDSISFTAEYVITQADIDAVVFENCVTATGTPPGEEVDDITSEESCVTTALTDASIELIKTGTFEDENGDGFAQLGETITYTFTVTNTGNVPLTDVTVTDTIGGVTITGGPIPSLATGAVDTTTFTGVYVPTQDDIDKGNFHNVAIVTGSSPGQGDDVTAEAENDTRLPHDPGIDLVKNGALDLGGNGQVDVGDVIVYTFTVTNTGNVTLFAPSLTDLSVLGLDIGCPWDDASDFSLGLGFENRVNCTATYTVTQADVDAGQIDNCASIIALSPAEVPVEDEDCFTVIGEQAPGIEIIKTAITPEVIEGDTATFEITITNTGNVTLSEVVVTDVLSPDCDRTFGAIFTPGETITYECTIDNVTADFTNVIVVTGIPPTTNPENPPEPVVDEDEESVTVVPEGEIGDTVWSDENANGIQDNGEKGIADATVMLTLPDGTTLSATTSPGSTTAEDITDSNGLYLFDELPAGEYTVELILSSIPKPSDGDLVLTTPASFTIQLAAGESFLDADFGVVAGLPVTGLSSDDIAMIALALLLAGGMAILATRKRKDEGDVAA